ncbi:pseudouridine synthase [Absidia repens]|uniref:Pseudouridine synthase n=1 Tax=Absidia repens TaxID=90262 RepID=A0A1X2IK81_9FUNG|nr:pseudouridine synthase [Absidia repens]
MDKYKDWTKEQLLSHIEKLETSQHGQESTTSSTTNTNNDNKKKSRKQQRPFDMTKYRQRRIALKVAYLGWRYAGFAAQGDEVNIPTVEGQLFSALEHCKLIVDRESCDYSRCGRTDRGVSGLGQVIILNVRSKRLATTITMNGDDDDDLPVDEELTYVDTLNHTLPDDIRMLAWAPVAPQLNARFDCQSRTYRYLFRKDQLDLTLMQQAAHQFIGSHDFRNFCKLDPSKNITNYHRHVLRCTIQPTVSPHLESITDDKEMVYLELQGTAFLWHQVRCMMSVLFLVGQQLEPPTIIKDLLDISQYASRPDYPMASDLPLILYDCEFAAISQWYYATPATHRTAAHWDQLSYAQHVRALTCDLFAAGTGLEQQQEQINPSSMEINNKKKVVVLGGGFSTLMANYKRLADRPRCDTDAMKKEKYSAKKRKRDQLDQADHQT